MALSVCTQQGRCGTRCSPRRGRSAGWGDATHAQSYAGRRAGCQGSEVRVPPGRVTGPSESCLQDGPQKRGVGRRAWPPVLPVTRLEPIHRGSRRPRGEAPRLHVPASGSRVLSPRLTCHHVRLHLSVCFQRLNEPFYKVVIYWECIAYMTSIHPGAHSQVFYMPEPT